MFSVFFILGLLSTLITLLFGFLFIRKRSRNYLTILVGFGVMLIALVIQSAIQSFPLLYVFLTHGSNLNVSKEIYIGIEKSYPLLIALFVGLMAGFWQEIMKYLAVGYAKEKDAPLIGYGFAIVDAVVFAIYLIYTNHVAVVISTTVIAAQAIAVLLQTPVSMMFNLGTAVFLREGIKTDKRVRNLGIATLAHAYMDGSLAYASILIMLFGYSESISIAIVWIPGLVVSLLFFLFLLRRVKKRAR